MKPTLSPVRFLSLWLPVVLWAALIYFLSGIPHLRITEASWDFIARKFAHVAEYGMFVRLVSRALVGSTFWPWRRIFFASLIIAIFYAMTDEFHQLFVAGRVGAVHDVAIDAAGAWLAMGLWP